MPQGCDSSQLVLRWLGGSRSGFRKIMFALRNKMIWYDGPSSAYCGCANKARGPKLCDRRRLIKLFFFVSLFTFFAAISMPIAAQSIDHKDGDYSFSNPVPQDKLRELSTDRPGKSHSAITVDVGHFQIESDFLNYTYDPHGQRDVTTRAYSVGTPILKYGVTSWMDIELGLALFNSLHQVSTIAIPISPETIARGFGDTLLGAKFNAFGNDGGDQSLAFLPFVRLPTASPGLGNGHIEFTLNVPYTIALSKPWSLTLEPNVGVLRNLNNTGYRGDLGFIVNLNRPILIKGLTAAAEVAVDQSTEKEAGTKVSFDPSLQYLVSKDLQLDVGIYLGLTRATARYNPYVGFSYRF